MSLKPSKLFKVLAVENRVKIIELLKSEGSLGAKYMAKKLGISVAAVSQHLKVLKQSGLVKSERNGYWIPYSVDKEMLEGCRDTFTNVCTCGCSNDKAVETSSCSCHNDDLKSLEKHRDELMEQLKEVKNRIKVLKK